MRFVFASSVLVLLACGPTPMMVDGGTQPLDAGADAGVDAGTPFRCEATPVTCQDQSILKLDFKTTLSNGTTREEGSKPGDRTYVNATAGGLNPTEAYYYLRFTPQGLQRVPLTDEEALTSMEWDIAFRRVIVRLNSGVSGPSCVVVGRTAPGTTFDGLTRVPANLTWRTEEYLTGSTCELVPDPSGLPNPATALSSYWSYASCVQTRGLNVYVIHLRDGRYVKFQVLSYYETAQQMTCNDTGMVPVPSGAGNYRIRWGFIDGP